MLLFLSGFVKVSQRVEELWSEHDLTDRQTDRHTDNYGKNYMSPPDEGNIIIPTERTRFVTDRQTNYGKNYMSPPDKGGIIIRMNK